MSLFLLNIRSAPDCIGTKEVPPRYLRGQLVLAILEGATDLLWQELKAEADSNEVTLLVVVLVITVAVNDHEVALATNGC